MVMTHQALLVSHFSSNILELTYALFSFIDYGQIRHKHLQNTRSLHFPQATKSDKTPLPFSFNFNNSIFVTTFTIDCIFRMSAKLFFNFLLTNTFFLRLFFFLDQTTFILPSQLPHLFYKFAILQKILKHEVHNSAFLFNLTTQLIKTYLGLCGRRFKDFVHFKSPCISSVFNIYNTIILHIVVCYYLRLFTRAIFFNRRPNSTVYPNIAFDLDLTTNARREFIDKLESKILMQDTNYLYAFNC